MSLAATSEDARESENTTSGLKFFMNLVSSVTWRRKVLIPNENPLVAAVLLKSIVPSLVTLKLMGTAS